MSDIGEVRNVVDRPGFYVKKRIPIEAMQFVVRPGYSNWESLEKFTDNQVRKPNKPSASAEMVEERFEVYDFLHDTWISFQPGDWILKGLKGEFYPHEGALFPEAYDEISMDDKILIELDD